MQWGFGQYIHIEELRLSPQDRPRFKNYLDLYVSSGAVSAARIFEEVYPKENQFFANNQIENHHAFFSLLQHFFAGEYEFSSPYIAPKNIHSLNLNNLREFLGSFERITISQLKEHLNKIGCENIEIRKVLDNISDEFILVDQETLLRKDKLIIDKEDLEDIEAFLFTEMQGREYVATHEINNYIFYPPLIVPWNRFLLKSIIKHFGKKLKVIDLEKAHHCMNEIIVKKNLSEENCSEILKTIFQKESGRNDFYTIQSITNESSKKASIFTHINHNEGLESDRARGRKGGRPKIKEKNIERMVSSADFICIGGEEISNGVVKLFRYSRHYGEVLVDLAQKGRIFVIPCGSDVPLVEDDTNETFWARVEEMARFWEGERVRRNQELENDEAKSTNLTPNKSIELKTTDDNTDVLSRNGCVNNITIPIEEKIPTFSEAANQINHLKDLEYQAANNSQEVFESNKKAKTPVPISFDLDEVMYERKVLENIRDNNYNTIIKLNLTQIPEFNLFYTKPISFTINDKKISVKNWRDLVLQVCNYLFENPKPQLTEVIKKNNFSLDPTALRNPSKISNSDYYIELGMNARDASAFITRILKAHSYDKDDFILEIIDKTKTQKQENISESQCINKIACIDTFLSPSILKRITTQVERIICELLKTKGERNHKADFECWFNDKLREECEKDEVLNTAYQTLSDSEGSIRKLFYSVINQNKSVCVLKDNYIYQRSVWALQYGDNLAEAIQVIFEQNKCTMHYRDIHKHLTSLDNDNFHNITKERVYNQLANQNEFFIKTGRGEFGLKSWGVEEWSPEKAVIELLQKAGKPRFNMTIMRELCESGDFSKSTIEQVLKNSPHIIEFNHQEYGLSQWKQNLQKQKTETIKSEIKPLSLEEGSLQNAIEMLAEELGLNFKDQKRLEIILPILITKGPMSMYEIVKHLIEENRFDEIRDYMLGNQPSSPEPLIKKGKDVCIRCDNTYNCFDNDITTDENRIDFVLKARNIYSKDILEKIRLNNDNKAFIKIVESPIYLRLLINYRLVELKNELTSVNYFNETNILHKKYGNYCPFIDVWQINSDFKFNLLSNAESELTPLCADNTPIKTEWDIDFNFSKKPDIMDFT